MGYNYWHDSVIYVSTDNALISGTSVQVGPMNAGRIFGITVSVGAMVRKGDVLAQVALPSQIGILQDGTPEMGFRGAGDERVDMTAPFDGQVTAVPLAIGSTVQIGQSIVTMVDPTQLYVTANVDEMNVGRAQVGQTVRVHVDALNADIPVTVRAITPATAASFSLLPTNNSSGNFNKVTQDVPVLVALNLDGQPAPLGASVEVKIKVTE